MLSDQLDDLSRQHGAVAYQDRSGYQRYGFTPAGLLNLLAEVNSEVRKQDTALIRQLVDALEHATAWAEEWRFAPAWVADAQAAICVAGVWLEGKP